MTNPLSQSQLGVYYACQTSVDEHVNYQCPAMFKLPKDIDVPRLKQAILDTLGAHPYVMSRIVEDTDGQPCTTDGLPPKVDVLHVTEDEWQEARKTFARTMDIHGERLYRVEIYVVGDLSYLYVDGHHVVVDGFTLSLILKDIERAYNGKKPTGEILDGVAVAQAEAAQREDEALMTEAREWYAHEFADAADTESLPIAMCENDKSQPEQLTTHFPLSLTKDEMQAMVKRFGVTEHIITEAAWGLLLAAYNAEEKASFCTVFWGRSDRRTLFTATMMVHTLPVFVGFRGDMTLADMLSSLDKQTQLTRQYQYYAYPDAARDLGINNQVMFVYQGSVLADKRGSLHLNGETLPFIDLKKPTPGWKLSAELFEHDNTYSLALCHNTADYTDEYLQQLARTYSTILRSMVSAEYVRDIDYCDDEQKLWLQQCNPQKTTVLPATDGLVVRFKQQVAAHPDAICVVAGDKRLTYAEVDRMTDTIDPVYTVPCGEYAVGYSVPRDEQMVLVPLSIAKAGKTLLPLDSSYPPERLEYMKQDAAKCQNRDAFVLLYTSGTTGEPKGVMLSERNVLAFCDFHIRHSGINNLSRYASYAGYGFDAYQQDLWSALICGAALYILPDEIRFDLEAMHHYFDEQGITHSFMTTQVATQMAINYPEMRTLQVLGTGGEKLMSINPPAYRLSNGYGPTESIAYVCSYSVNKQEPNIPIGFPNDTSRLYIVGKYGKQLPWGAAGELLVAGEQVSLGYLNKPEKTAESFVEWNGERVYRTGDIVRYRQDGAIEFVGRKDGQVKIRGFRIELKEVESVIREFPGIKDATVQAFDEEGGGKFIAAYVVSNQAVDIEALNQFILDQKPPYMVPAVTKQIAAIPLNQNQKVNKRALPKPEKKAAAVEAVAAPMNVLEQELHQMIGEIVNNTDFGVTTVLGYAGLTSISAIRLAVQVNKRYDVTLDSRALVKSGTLQSIENEILKHLLQGGGKPAVTPVEVARPKATSVPLSYAQTGVYYDCLKNPTSTIYNIPHLLTYPAGVAAAELAQAVKRVFETHPVLNVHFTTQGDTIVQTTEGAVPVEVPITRMTDEELNAYKNEFVQPFNLQKPPLYRCQVVETPQGVHLLLDVHHLLFDGGSADLLIRQISAALEGGAVENESYNYMDFVADQQEAEQSEEFAQAQKFFAERLQTCEGASEIPADLPKTDNQGFIGEAVCPADFEEASAACRQLNVTPAHLFLAATAYVVSRYTNNRDVYLCTVSSGRSNLKISDTVGMFVNTLALGLSIDDVSVADFLRMTSENFDQTLRHEDYPFARIANDYGFRPAIAYAYQVGVLSQYTVNGKLIGQELLELNVPKFKINIKIETCGVVVEYDDSLYSQRLAQALADSIVTVAHRMASQPQARLRQLSIVSPRQEEELSHLRQTATGDAPFTFFHDCIHHFAQVQPDHEALVAIDAKYTYREMDLATDSIAAALRQRGVHERDRVALLLPRTSRLILALFGVLKAGAAYIPCDPEYPAERVRLILEDSEARYIITTADRMDTVPADKAIDVEQLLDADAAQYVKPDITPDDLAYLIYTSGSTGRPKGVMLHHRGICNYLYGHPANVFANGVMTDALRILSVTTISFDAALQDIGTAFYNGKTLVVATEEQANNPIDLARLITEQGVNMVSGTPSRWQTWLTSEDFCHAISQVDICRAGGEKFSDQLLNQMRSVTKARIFNCYGPTEITVASNNKELTHATMVTVGKPQLNVKEFIVDQDGNELPVGVVGELYIGGRGVAHGYNNLDEMTRERFIDYHGERIYRSGDYARWLPDGDVVILGRTDHQIKLRGLRIELGEIENVMLKVEGMKKVVILIRKINDKEHLCAYYTADREIAPDALKNEISQSLTQYMVPTAYLQLDEMPMTPNGKTDVKALPEPQLAITSAFVEAASDTERTFCNIFADILQMDKVGATDNFFELGGTSLVVTRVIIEADKAGIHVAYGDVFANPTPRQLARLVTGEEVDGEADEAAHFDYTAINNLLQRNTLDNFRHGERQSLGNVLLTGATGYLGIHILRELIDTDAPHIYCLVRGKTQEKAENRLRTLLFYYFADSFKELFGKRLHVVLGDVTNDLDESLPIDTVFNCAAIVKHFSEGTEIEDVNIGGAQRCVNFCIKTGAKLVHISTASTRGLWAGEPKDETFTEQKLYMGQYLGNKYIYSKFMAERLILDAVALHGLKAKIMRVGNLAARSTDGEFQANFATNSFMGRIKVYNMLGCCPFSMRNKNVEFSPINEVAQAIVRLSTTPVECTVFHPYNIHGQFLGDVLSGLSSVGEGVRFVEQEEFAEQMEQAKDDPVKAKQLSSLLAYQDMAHGQKTTDVARDNDYTTQVLYRLGFAWSPTSWDYVERMLTAIGGFGFFDF